MKIKYLAILVIALMGSAVLTGKILAQEASDEANFTYPIAELNNCKDKEDCLAYCDLPQNIEACVNFGERNNLMSEEKVQKAKKFIAVGAKGPGGCSGKDACETYCNGIANIDECVAFAEKNDLMPPAELVEAKQIQAAIKRGVRPPNCNSKQSCDVYCEEADHMEECVAFGIEAGFIQGKELEDAQKMVAAVKRGVRPPPCRGKDACDLYCSEPENMEVCMNFAIEAGFMNEEEAAQSQKMLTAVKNGIKPPKCRGRDQCDAYCSSEEHFEECTNFAEAAGFMSADEAIMARKTKGKTPGGCKGKEECEAFCNNPDNQETCFNFAKENGMIPDEELKKMEEGRQQMQGQLNQMPPAVQTCIESLLGKDVADKIKSGEMMPSKEIGDTMSECFRQMGPPPGEQGAPPNEGFGGNPPEGNNMIPPPNGQFQGPGGCTSPEECRAYCESNPEACRNFLPPNTQGQQIPQDQPLTQIPQNPDPIPYNNQNPPDGFQPPPGVSCSSQEECQRIMQEQIQNQFTQQIPPPGTYPEMPQNTYPTDQYGTPPPDGQYQYPAQPMEPLPPPPTE